MRVSSSDCALEYSTSLKGKGSEEERTLQFHSSVKS